MSTLVKLRTSKPLNLMGGLEIKLSIPHGKGIRRGHIILNDDEVLFMENAIREYKEIRASHNIPITD